MFLPAFPITRSMPFCLRYFVGDVLIRFCRKGLHHLVCWRFDGTPWCRLPTTASQRCAPNLSSCSPHSWGCFGLVFFQIIHRGTSIASRICCFLGQQILSAISISSSHALGFLNHKTSVKIRDGCERSRGASALSGREQPHEQDSALKTLTPPTNQGNTKHPKKAHGARLHGIRAAREINLQQTSMCLHCFIPFRNN